MTLRPYKPEDSKIICSWVKDEKQLFQWSADRIGKWPLPEDSLNENYQGKNPELFIPLTAVDENNRPSGQPHHPGSILQQPESPRLLRIRRLQGI